MTCNLSRRSFVAGAAMTPFLLSHSPLVKAGERQIAIWGPPAGPSITLVHALRTGMLNHVGDDVTFRKWRNPDEVRAGLTSDAVEVMIMPTTTAANLYNRGIGVVLVNVMTNGLLYIMTRDSAVSSLADLRGRKLAVPFRNDTPDILLNQLLAHQGLHPNDDLGVRSTGSPTEAIQLLLSSRVDAALVPEPAASAAQIKAAKLGRSLHRAIDVQQAWRTAVGKDVALPQAGLTVTTSFQEQRPDVVANLQQALVEATNAINQDPKRAARTVAATLEFPTPVIEHAIPFSNLVARPAREARSDLEVMFSEIVARDSAVLGGQLPNGTFYL